MKKIALISLASLLLIYLTGPLFLPRTAQAYLYYLDPALREARLKSIRAIDGAIENCRSIASDKVFESCVNRNYDKLNH
jgi:hypothetical protein